MRQWMQSGGVCALAMVLGACANSSGWKGVKLETEYERTSVAGRLSAPRDNRFYAEIHRDARIYVFADADEYVRFRWSGRVERAVTAIAAGANGQTVQFALNREEAREQERQVAYRGAAQEMFGGRLAGDVDGFYGEIHRDDRIYVFASWAELQQFRRDGGVADAEPMPEFGPEQQTVIVAGPPDEALARFRALYRLR
jgi:hypothetical protein